MDGLWESLQQEGNSFSLTQSPHALFTHPQQGLLGLWLMLIAGRLNALAHCFWEQFLVLDLPQVLICLLALLLQRSTASK